MTKGNYIIWPFRPFCNFKKIFKLIFCLLQLPLQFVFTFSVKCSIYAMHDAFHQVSPEYASYQPCLCLLRSSPAVLIASSWSWSHIESFDSFGCSWKYLLSTSPLIPRWLCISWGTNSPLNAQLHLCCCLSKVGRSDLRDGLWEWPSCSQTPQPA